MNEKIDQEIVRNPNRRHELSKKLPSAVKAALIDWEIEIRRRIKIKNFNSQ